VSANSTSKHTATERSDAANTAACGGAVCASARQVGAASSVGFVRRVALRPAAVVRIVKECALLPVRTCREGGPDAVRRRLFA
jgi:hypothetical protein